MSGEIAGRRQRGRRTASRPSANISKSTTSHTALGRPLTTSRAFSDSWASSRAINPVKGVYDYRSDEERERDQRERGGRRLADLFQSHHKARPRDLRALGHPARNNDRPLDTKYSFREVYGEEAARELLRGPLLVEEKTLDYFDIAENFIGVNKITTTAALGRFKLGKSRVFQQAAADIDLSAGDLMNPGDLDADLSITDVTDGTFGGRNPTKAKERASPADERLRAPGKVRPRLHPRSEAHDEPAPLRRHQRREAHRRLPPVPGRLHRGER